MKHLKIACLLIFVSLCLSGCPGLVGDINSDSNQDNDIASDNETIITTITDNSNNGGADGMGAVCDGAGGNDGPGGFLWKPVSEGDGNLAVLFPQEFSRPFMSVTVERITERDEESGDALETEIEFGEPDGFFEDGRQVWRFAAPGGDYTGIVKVDDTNQSCEWRIDGDPAERND